jgi:DNA (cytosine-5)-methyltransferase 1
VKFGSLFAGVGGFDLGFEAAGFECCWQVEWDKYCQEVLRFRWPDVPKLKDVRDVSGYDLEPVDVITYGFPCQDLSIAGYQAGLDGDRSGLFFEAIRIIKEMRDATDGQFPRVAIAENVTGLLSADGGSAMGRCLDTLAEAGALAIEWCVLDSQWFGVPQRRKRVFLASVFDSVAAGRCAGEIFSLAESGAGYPEQVGAEGEAVAGGVEGGSGNVGSYRMLGFGHYTDDDSASTLKARDYKDATDLVAFVKAKRAQSSSDTESWVAGGPAPTLNCFDQGDVRATVLVSSDVALRRLSPVECERLMGWPDDHTKFRADGKLTSDSQRFKMCGNGVVAPVASWVAKSIARVL